MIQGVLGLTNYICKSFLICIKLFYPLSPSQISCRLEILLVKYQLSQYHFYLDKFPTLLYLERFRDSMFNIQPEKPR